jgi:hypothetical protein
VTTKEKLKLSPLLKKALSKRTRKNRPKEPKDGCELKGLPTSVREHLTYAIASSGFTVEEV